MHPSPHRPPVPDTTPPEPAIQVGDRVLVVEHNDQTRQPLEGGDIHPGVCVAADGLYVQVRYDDQALHSGRPDVFYKESGWRAWDGQFRWRLAGGAR